MRQLSGLEKWRLTGLSSSKADVLIDAGFGVQLGPLAGNFIPIRMTEAVSKDEASRIARDGIGCRPWEVRKLLAVMYNCSGS